MSDLTQFSPPRAGIAGKNLIGPLPRGVVRRRIVPKGTMGPLEYGVQRRAAPRRTDGVAKATAGNLARDVLGKEGRVAADGSKALKDAVDRYIAAASAKVKATAEAARLKTATGHVLEHAFKEPILGYRAPASVLSAHAGVSKLSTGGRGVAVATVHKAVTGLTLRAGTEASELIQRAAQAYGKALAEKAATYTHSAGRKTLLPRDIAAALVGPLNC